MYIVYVNHVCKLGDYGSNDTEISLITDNKITAKSKAYELVDSYKSDPAAHIDSEWSGSFDYSSDSECIVFWDKPENWDWYSEIHVVERLVGKDYLPYD